MVLGMVTGSVPMLFSLLLMQGITLTMWRSFLDKAIPRFNGSNLRKNLEQAIATTSNVANVPNLVNTGQTAAGMQMATSMQSSPSEEQVSNMVSPNSFVQSLQILSKLDPNVIQLLNQLNSKFNAPPVQQNTLKSPTNEMDNPGNLFLSSPNDIYLKEEFTTITSQYEQEYNPNIDQSPVKYMEVSSDGLSQSYYPNAEQYQQQYIYHQYQNPHFQDSQQEVINPNSYDQTQQIDPNTEDKMQYEYIIENQDVPTTTVNPVDKSVEIPIQQDSHQMIKLDEQQIKGAESEDDKEVAEDGRMPHVIIGPPINSVGQVQKRMREKQRSTMDASTISRVKTKKIVKRMFGKPRVITKRMLSFEPVTKRLKKTKKLISNSILGSSRRLQIQTTQKPKISNIWNHELYEPSYRFATPRYHIPLLEPLRSNKKFFNPSSNEKVHHFESRSSMDPKRDLVTVVMSNRTRNVKLKSKKIRLIEIDEFKSNCKNLSGHAKKDKFSVVWSQRTGWPQHNNINNCTRPVDQKESVEQVQLTTEMNLNNITEKNIKTASTILSSVDQIQFETDRNSFQFEVTTSVPWSDKQVPNAATTIHSPSITSSVASVFTSPFPIVTTMSSTAIPTIAIPKSFFENFNQFLSSITATQIRSSTTTATITTSTTPLPIITSSTTTSFISEANSVDQLPKEFLYHVLMAINASKIDDYQFRTNSNNIAKESDLSNSGKRIMCSLYVHFLMFVC